jgi:two-component system cell cycle response regulator
MAQSRPDIRAKLSVAGAALALGYLAFVVHAALQSGDSAGSELFDTWLYEGLLIGAAGLCLARAKLVRRERAAWLLIGLGLSVWVAGEIYYAIALSGAETVPIPSPADLGYLGFYPLTYVGLILLLRARIGSFSAPQWLDGLIVGSAIAALVAVLALAPIEAASTTGSTLAIATNLAYPIADLTLLVLVITAAAFTGWRPGRSWLMLGAGLIVLACSDGAYLLQSAQGTYVEGGLLDAAWPLGALLLATAAWMDPGHRRPAPQQGIRLALIPAGAALVAVGLQFSAELTPISVLAEVLTLFTLLCVVARMALSFRENQQRLQASISDSLTDALTGLANRRRLMTELERAARSVASEEVLRLFVIFDLDGFKAYNDAFGHPAGDALLIRLGRRLESFASPRGRAYRLGGDEFCLLAETSAADVDALIIGAAAALSEQGDGFRVISSLGSVLLPSEASSAEAALQLADQRMYANKNSGRSSAGSQSRDVLVMALRERQPELHAHLTDVAGYASKVATELRMDAEQRDEVVRAAQLHDTGKMAIPDALLQKPGPLDEEEWEFMRRHTVIGERIIAAAPALGPVAQLVRSSHERWDGSGYPDGLVAEEIPLGSRIVTVCDAYEAMIADRPYGEQRSAEEAMAELESCAGTQFDPAVVTAFITVTVAGLSPGREDAGDPPPSVSAPPDRSFPSG